jgi:hypothetical protein
MVAIPGSRLKESRGVPPAQLSPPSGTATACCFHIAHGLGGVGVFVFNVFTSSNSAAPPDLPLKGTFQFSQYSALRADLF